MYSQKQKITPKEVDNKRYVPDGVSIFDLIMPWKQDIIAQKDSISKDLYKVVQLTGKNKV